MPTAASTTTPPARKRPAPRLVTVSEVFDISPALRRLRLTSPSLSELDPGPAAITIKLLFPRPGQSAPVLPVIGPDGPVMPDPSMRPINRPFTFHTFNRVAGSLDVDFILHEGNGFACNWARSAEPGMQLGLVGPMSDRSLPAAPHYIFIGDDTAVPAITVLQKSIGNSTSEAILEVSSQDGISGITDVTWIERQPSGLGRGEGFTGLIGKLAPAADTFVWLAGEASAVEALRRHLRFDLGLPKAQVIATPYWKKGLNEETFHNERHKAMDNQD